MAKTPDDGATDGRAESRRRVLLGGKLIYGEPPLSLDCQVADISQSGARIRLEGPEPLRDPIYLVVISQGLAFLAKEEWRRGATIGLSFSRAFDLKSPPSGLPGIVRQLWLEQTRGRPSE
jgi:hypothetical protein